MNNEHEPIWIGTCPKCGPVRIEQHTKPTSCPQPVLFGTRIARRCRETLTNVMSTRGKS